MEFSDDLVDALVRGTLDDRPRFVERLNQLIETAPLFNGDNEAVAAAVRAHGGEVDRSYISRLRHGVRDNPSFQLIVPLSRAFDVPVAYWFSEAVALEVLTLRRPPASF